MASQIDEAQALAAIENMPITPEVLMALGSRIEFVWGEWSDASVIEAAGTVSAALDDLRDEIERNG